MKATAILLMLLAFGINASTAVFAQKIDTTVLKRPWYLPNQAILQFAGNIGFLSAGVGYSAKRDKINFDILYGYTPSFEAETSIHTLTAKFIYSPSKQTIRPMLQWEPFQVGAGVSYSFGPQFYTTLPQHYPDGYYFWPTSFRLTPFIGTAISKTMGNEKAAIKRLKAYGEIGTHDLAILSLVTNKSLPPWNIISFAIGIKLGL